MPNYFYIDANGQKHGLINDQQLKALAERGIITPTTPLMTDTGHKGVAGQIRGLFNDPPSISVPVAAGNNIPLWAIIAGVLVLLVVGVVAGRMLTPATAPPTGQVQAVQDNAAVVEAPVNVPSPKQNDPPKPSDTLSQFTAAERLEIERFLGEYGSDLKAVRNSPGLGDGYTVMHNAARHGTLAVVKYFVSQDVSIHARTSRRITPLHLAMWNTSEDNIEIVKFLVSQGADVNVKDSNNRTPLYLAIGSASAHDAETVRFLIANGADVNITDSSSIARDVYGNNYTLVNIARRNVSQAKTASDKAKAEAVLAALLEAVE